VPNLPNSLSNLLIEVLFEGARGVVDIPTHQYLQAFEVTAAHDSAWKGSITLFDRTSIELETLFIGAGHSRLLYLRWGWDYGQGVTANPQYIARILRYTPEFSPEGVTITLDFVAAPAVEPLLDRTRQPRSWPAGMLASDVFRKVAEKWGWATVDQHGRSTVEDSVGELPELSMSEESDIKFIRETLLPKSQNADKQHFLFWFARDTVHFHSVNYTKKSAAVYEFARDAYGDVVRFAPVDTGLFATIWGGRRAIYEAVNSVEGTRTEQETSDDTNVEGGKTVVFQDAQYFEQFGDGVKAKIPVSARTPEELEREVATKLQQMRELTYSANLEVRGTHAVAPQDLVTVNYHLPDGSAHYLSGTFKSREVTHRVDSGGWVTSMVLHRPGAKEPPVPMAKHAANQVVEPAENVETQGSNTASELTARGYTPVPGTVTRPVLRR